MFGELEDSDIYVNNQNFSFDEQPVAEAQEVNAPENKPSNENTESGGKSVYAFAVILAVLLLLGGGFYYYNMNKETAGDAVSLGQDSQDMGDYFYNQAAENNPEEQARIASEEGANEAAKSQDAVVSLDVDLNPANTAQKPVKTAQVDVPNPQAQVKIPEEKTVNPPAKEKEKSNLILSDNTNKQVMVTIANGGRFDPFTPYKARDNSAGAVKFDIIPPPPEIPDLDPLGEELMATRISGIMYDSSRPSAIINFDGTDHLVHKGDSVKGYSVLDITKDRVVLKLGDNIYRASVGQQVESRVNFNEVSNVNRQFGGAYNKSNNIIEIKPIN